MAAYPSEKTPNSASDVSQNRRIGLVFHGSTSSDKDPVYSQQLFSPGGGEKKEIERIYRQRILSAEVGEQLLTLSVTSR